MGLTVFAKRTANAPVKFRRRGPALAYLLLRLSPGQKRFLVAGSLLILALTFGTTLRQDWSTAGVQLIYAAIYAALLALDPDARTVPYMLSGGTDAKAFARLGIRCFGFTPLRLPPDLDFTSLFHGVDERVPVDALRFGTEVLAHFLTHC